MTTKTMKFLAVIKLQDEEKPSLSSTEIPVDRMDSDTCVNFVDSFPFDAVYKEFGVHYFQEEIDKHMFDHIYNTIDDRSDDYDEEYDVI